MKQEYRLVPEEDCNPMGNMHGGRIATLVDSATCLAASIEARSKRYGVSMDLSVSYLRGIDVNKHQDIVVETVIENAGNKIFFTSCKLKSLDGSETFAIGRQTMFMVPTRRPLFTPETIEE